MSSTSIKNSNCISSFSLKFHLKQIACDLTISFNENIIEIGFEKDSHHKIVGFNEISRMIRKLIGLKRYLKKKGNIDIELELQISNAEYIFFESNVS